ncbi:MAG: hypothetical protein KGD63_05295 [Candidatus Lokiarchaeota archaeon]|nr:hypothetical protein [Candidatus Lokiarchaeota archaeon]
MFGGLGGISQYNPLPLYDIASLTTIGANMKDILHLMIKYYSNIHRETLRTRINEFFESWDNIEILFLKPLVEGLVLEKYPDKEIYDALVSKKPNYRCWLFSWFKGAIYLDFKYWDGSKYFVNIEESNLEYNKEQRYFGIIRNQWEKWILDNMNRNKIAEITGLTVSSVKYVIREKFGGRYNYLCSYRREKTIELLAKGINLREIYEKYFQKKFFTTHGREAFERCFDGLTLEQIIEKYKV